MRLQKRFEEKKRASNIRQSVICRLVQREEGVKKSKERMEKESAPPVFDIFYRYNEIVEKGVVLLI